MSIMPKLSDFHQNVNNWFSISNIIIAKSNKASDFSAVRHPQADSWEKFYHWISVGDAHRAVARTLIINIKGIFIYAKHIEIYVR